MWGKTAKPLDADGQVLAEGFIQDTYVMAFAYHRRYAADMPREELVAEALVGLVYAASKFALARGVPFKDYATMVIHHAMANAVRRWRHWQRAGSWPTDDDGRQLEPASEPVDPVDWLAVVEAIEQTRDALPAKVFEVLWLRFAEELTLAEIGKRFGFSHQNAAQLLERGLAIAGKLP